MTVYEASTLNTRKLKKEKTVLERQIKRAIREGKECEVKTYTFIYALLYSAYAEASFLKLIHTHDGFSTSEIAEIMKQRNLEERWKKCFELAFKNVINSTNAGEVANKKKNLFDILNEHIIEPSQIRNKIAHGQWAICLNNDCTSYNPDTTSKLAALDPVYLMREFNIYMQFAICIEYIIVSPKKAHPNYYYQQCTDITKYINDTSSWNYESYRKKILHSPKMKHFNRSKAS